jgi:hypothetical protein
MKKNEHIFISLQIQKDQDSKGLLITVQFDKNAPNFSMGGEDIFWCPTGEEIDFIAEAFGLIDGYKGSQSSTEKPRYTTDHHTPIKSKEQSHSSSEMRIAPLPEEKVIEVTTDSESLPAQKTKDDKIFVQADDKTIDEVLKRKKPAMNEDYGIESGDKTLIDRMLKQKKKKE